MNLQTEISELRQTQTTFEFRANTFLADLVLLGLSVEVEESARAVQSLIATDLPHRALPLARTAYEAAQQLRRAHALDGARQAPRETRLRRSVPRSHLRKPVPDGR